MLFGRGDGCGNRRGLPSLAVTPGTGEILSATSHLGRFLLHWALFQTDDPWLSEPTAPAAGQTIASRFGSPPCAILARIETVRGSLSGSEGKVAHALSVTAHNRTANFGFLQ